MGIRYEEQNIPRLYVFWSMIALIIEGINAPTMQVIHTPSSPCFYHAHEAFQLRRQKKVFPHCKNICKMKSVCISVLKNYAIEMKKIFLGSVARNFFRFLAYYRCIHFVDYYCIYICTNFA